MCRFIETILVKNNKLENIDYHNFRLNKSRYDFFKLSDILKIENEISVPDELNKNEIYRCRIIYSDVIESYEFIPYIKKEIKTLQLVISNTIEYNYKYENRSCIELLKKDIDADDILILKNGLITDTSIANIVFRKNDDWFTPRIPLLKGTQRAKLIDEGKIKPIDIAVKDIHAFDAFVTINALRPFCEMESLSCDFINM
ncbi:aminotransferase class IV [Apibacter raozihei]|uniref:aminotransferase class IV n=1 Tax=Apibacter raozihei TaxID=2500547 RepID=UPI000FE3D368|nr:aminotransferase class IV [Apibacter raozihei]